MAALLAQRLGRLPDLAQPLSDRLIEPVARLGQEDPALAPLEQPDSQVFLQQAHRPADGAMGEVQLVGGATEVLGAGSHLEAAQGRQGGKREGFM